MLHLLAPSQTKTDVRVSEERELRALMYFNHDIRGLIGVEDVVSRVLTRTNSAFEDIEEGMDEGMDEEGYRATVVFGNKSKHHAARGLKVLSTPPIATDYTLVVQVCAQSITGCSRGESQSSSFLEDAQWPYLCSSFALHSDLSCILS